MRILIFPPALRIGGSQLNALELAEELHRRGHDVVVFSEDGPLRSRRGDRVALRAGAREAQGPAVAGHCSQTRRRGAPIPRGRGSRLRMASHSGGGVRALPALGTPVVGTVMSMGVAPFIPRHLPLVVGTAQIAAVERERREVVELVEPPVDVAANHPGMGGALARSELGIDADAFAVVVVSRLANELKREGLLEGDSRRGSPGSRHAHPAHRRRRWPGAPRDRDERAGDQCCRGTRGRDAHRIGPGPAGISTTRPTWCWAWAVRHCVAWPSPNRWSCRGSEASGGCWSSHRWRPFSPRLVRHRFRR